MVMALLAKLPLVRYWTEPSGLTAPHTSLCTPYVALHTTRRFGPALPPARLGLPGLFGLFAASSLASLLFVGLCVPGDAGLGHGPTSQGRREQESESNTPAGLASRRGEALLLTRSYGGVGAVLGPYSEERAYSNRSSSSEYYNRS